MTTTVGGPSYSSALRGPGSMRQANEWVVLERLRSHAPVSVPELASDTGLSRPTVNLALARLEEDGLVRQTGRRTGNAGRAARLWEPHVDTGRVISVDVGAQWVRLALADLGGTVLDRRQEPSRALSATDLVHQVSRLVAELLESNEVTRDQLLSTVVGSPGIYDPASRRLRHAYNLPGWDRPTIVGLLTDEFGDSIRFENDIDLAALGEQAAGLGRGIPDFVYLSVGSGVGMGTITGGRLHRGARGAAGEIAFLLVGDPTQEPLEEVRLRGAFESAAAADAIVAAARDAGMGDKCSVEDVFTAARAGHSVASAIVDREVDLLARALVAVVALIDPQLVVLGGGVGGHAEFLLEPLGRRLAELVPLPLPELAVSAVGEDATVIGGVAQAVDAAWRRAFGACQRRRQESENELQGGERWQAGAFN
ncbi:ROK family transcriptional regulator [Streptomyces sp. Ru72]|uniref:ROK family transcriptional regulator n=1 Tax=Streptomyces sp. Ru72 TaxID=2080747 RepID=UPI0015E2E794|nr:ROK family transcriptional regulator [Streptomyces sp. Ru72]